MSPGERLRALREKLGFTLKDVEIASLQLVQKYNNPKYWLPQSRLCHIESKGILPNIYRLHAFAMIYRRPLMELLALYGVDPQQSQSLLSPPRTHLTSDAGMTGCDSGEALLRHYVRKSSHLDSDRDKTDLVVSFLYRKKVQQYEGEDDPAAGVFPISLVAPRRSLCVCVWMVF